MVPYTNIVSVSKDREYEQNYMVHGFQFERMMTGKKATDDHDMESVEHLHVMKFKSYTILFCAEVDALGQDGSPVETTVSNWIQIKVFQMISNGSCELCYGMRQGSQAVQEIRTLSLSSLSEQLFNYYKSQYGCDPTWIENIAAGLESLRAASFPAGEAHRLIFKPNGDTKFEKIADPKLFPSEAVVKELLVED